MNLECSHHRKDGLIAKVKDFVLRWLPPSIFIRLHAWHYYFFSEPELRLLPILIAPHSNAIDVGANYGVYSYYLSGLASHVYAYEPNPRLAARLIKAVRPNVTVIEAGLSDHAGTAVLTVPLYDDGRQIHGWGTIEKQSFDSQTCQTSIAINRLDDEPYENISFIKIDVEGHEEAVIRGALSLINRCHPRLLIEIEQWHLHKSVREVVDYIESLGYCTFTIQAASNPRKTSWRKINISDKLLEIDGVKPPCNYLFIHKQDPICNRLDD